MNHRGSLKSFISDSYDYGPSGTFEELQVVKQSDTTSKVQVTEGSNSATYNRQAVFSKRQGAGNVKGQLYKIELSMFFLLQGQIEKAARRIDGFHLASNMAEAGIFKDVVFKYRYRDLIAEDGNKNEKSKIIFLHSIHVDDPKTKKITADVFSSQAEKKKEKHLVISLQEHFRSYHAIKNQFYEPNGEHPVFGSSFEDSEFLIFTNAMPAFGKNEDIIEEISSDTESILRFHATKEKNSYWKLIFSGDTQNITEDRKSEISGQDRIISTLQNSSECKKLAKELVKSVFPSKDGKNAEIVHQGILKKYHIPLSQAVIIKNDPKAKRGEFSIKFIDGGKNLSPEDNNFRKEFFEEAERITQKTEIELKQELRDKIIKLCEKFGEDIGTGEDYIRSLPNDRVSEGEITAFFSKLKLFTGQPGEESLAEIIREKMKSAYSVEEEDAVFSDVKEKVQWWWKEKTKTYLTEKTRFFQDSIRISISFDIQKPVETFTGRKQELRHLRNVLQPQSDKESAETPMVVITGLGGAGKTELARQFIFKRSQDFDNNVIWINAKSYGSLTNSFLRLAKKLKISTENVQGKIKDIRSIVQDVYQYFSMRKCLFSFDSAERYKTHDDCDSAIDKFLPVFSQNKKVFVLVTSDNKDWGNTKTLPLDSLKDEEATELIRNVLNIEPGFQEAEIHELSTKLQRMPLALQHVVAYIREENERKTNKRCKFTIKDYLEKCKEAGRTMKDLLSYEPIGGNSYGKSIFVTLKITLRKIGNMNYGDEALRILNVMSYFAPNNISTNIFLEPNKNKRHLASALQLLRQYSIIGLVQGGANIHRLVQEVVLTELATQGKEEEVLRDAMNLLKQVMPDKTNCQYAQHAMSVWTHTSQHVDLVKDFSMLPHNIMHELDIGVRYQEASSFGRTASLLLEKVLGPDHVDTLLLMSNTADALACAGKYDEALKLYEILLTKCIEKFGADNFRTLTVKSSMAATLHTVGKYDDALKIFRELLDQRKQTVGDDHIYTLSAMNSTATVLASLGEKTEALEIYQTVLEKRSRILGRYHLDTLTTMHDIAGMFYSVGKHDQAFKIYQEVLEKRRKVLGPEHPLTLLTINNMKTVVYRRQKYDDALPDYQDVVERTEKVFGPDHFQSYMAKQSLALILRDQGNYDEALATCEEILDSGKERLYNNHPFILETKSIKAAVLFRQHKYDEAYTVYQELMETKRDVSGPDDPETLAVMEDKASVLSEQGEFDNALLLYQEVLHKKLQTLGPNHHDTIITELNIAALQGKRGNYEQALKSNKLILNKMQDTSELSSHDILCAKENIVVSLCELGNYNEALKVCKELYDQTKQVWGADHHLTLSAKRKLASVLFLQGHHDKALDTLQDILDRGHQILTPEHPDNFRTKNSIAAVLDIKGYHRMAFKTYQEVLNKRKEVFGTDDWETLETQKDIALSLYTQGKYKESLKTSRVVLDKIKQVLGSVHPSVLLIQNNIARALSKQGKYIEALEICEDILKKCHKFLGPDHPRTLDTKNDLAELQDEQGNYNLSLEIYEEVLQRRKKLFGPHHLSTLDTKNNMARVRAHLCQYQSALKIYFEVLDETEKILSSDHPSTLATKNNIAAVLIKQGYDEEALKIYEEIFDKQRKRFPECHPDTLSIMSNIAEIYGRQQNFDLSLKYYKDVLDRRIHTLGPNHPDTLSTRNDIAGIYFKQGNWEEALSIYSAVLGRLNEVLGSCHLHVLSTQDRIAEVHNSQGSYTNAVQLYGDILYKSKQTQGSDHPFTLGTMDKLATTLYNCGYFEEALKLRKETLDKEMKILGRDHPLTLRTSCNLVKELDELGKQDDLIDTYVYVMDKEDLLDLYYRDPLYTGDGVLRKLAREGRLEVLGYLLDNGADVLNSSENGTLLLEAVANDNKEVVKLILSKIEEKGDDIGSHINASDEEGNTPLMWAAASGSSNSARVLIGYGANVNAKNTNCQTALHWASKGGNEDIAEMLLDNKADPNAEDVNGKTALDAACEKLGNDMEILKDVCKDLKTITALLRGVTQEPSVSQEYTICQNRS